MQNYNCFYLFILFKTHKNLITFKCVLVQFRQLKLFDKPPLKKTCFTNMEISRNNLQNKTHFLGMLTCQAHLTRQFTLTHDLALDPQPPRNFSRGHKDQLLASRTRWKDCRRPELSSSGRCEGIKPIFTCGRSQSKGHMRRLQSHALRERRSRVGVRLLIVILCTNFPNKFHKFTSKLAEKFKEFFFYLLNQQLY